MYASEGISRQWRVCRISLFLHDAHDTGTWRGHSALTVYSPVCELGDVHSRAGTLEKWYLDMFFTVVEESFGHHPHPWMSLHMGLCPCGFLCPVVLDPKEGNFWCESLQDPPLSAPCLPSVGGEDS